MKKVAILSVGDLRHISMISLYTEFMKKHNVEFEIICTNRYMDKVNSYDNVVTHAFEWLSSTSINKISKLKPFYKFRKYAKQIIETKRYDFLIVWNENTALLFADLLIGKYKKRHCINIRDFGIDNYGILRIIKGAVIRSSAFSTYCSPSGVELQPKFNYTIMLNQDFKVLKNYKPKTAFKKQIEKLVITYMGIMRTEHSCKKIIQAFGNDDRYIIRFFGPEVELLSDFVKDHKYENIVLGGAFPPEKTVEYLNTTDIINSYYGDNLLSLKHAVGVKESYAPLLRLPVIVDPDTFWAKISKKYGFGFVIENFETLADDLYNWYHSLDFDEFNKGCQDYCDYVKQVNSIFYQECTKYLL